MRKVLYLLVVSVLCSLAYDAHSQMNRRAIKKNNRRISHYRGRKSHFGKDKIYNSLGFSVNALNYYGDLAPKPGRFSTDISFTRPAIALSFAHRFGPRYTLTASFMYGGLRGADAESADFEDDNGFYRYNRNLSFRNRIKEFSVVASLDLFENMATYISRVKWTPYIFAGVAVFHHNPQAQVPRTGVDGVTPLENAGEWVNLQPLGTEGQNRDLPSNSWNAGIKPYKLIQPAIPFGFGVRFRLNEVMDVAGEFGFRYLFTDYIDDVSKNYVDLGVFGNDELAKAMSYRSFELPEYSPSIDENKFGDPNTLTPATLVSYQGSDGNTYWVVPGYGGEYGPTPNKRGNSSDKDIYTVFTIKVTYILGKTFHRAKFR